MSHRTHSLLFALGAFGLIDPLPCGGQTPAQWTLTPELRIEGSRGADYEFTRILDVVPAPNGLLLVADVRPPELRVFDATGTYVRTIGRTGSGPGEFQLLRYLGVLGDTLWTIDGALRRITLFTLDGRAITTIPYMTPPGSRTDGRTSDVHITSILPGGFATGRPSYAASDLAAGRVPSVPLLRMTRDGGTLDTIVMLSTANSQLAVSRGGMQLFMQQPHSDTPLAIAASAANRVFLVDRAVATTARGATFGVTALRLTGDTLWTRRYTYLPNRIETHQVHEITAGNVTFSREEVRSQTFLPDFRTPVTEAVAATDGALWLRREAGPGEQVEYTVINPNGALAATLTLARRVTVKAVRGSQVWTVETDDDGVQTVVRSRVSR